MADYNTALEIKPDLVTALSARGDVYLSRGEEDRAMDDYNAALTAQSDYAPAMNGLGYLYLGRRMYDLAIVQSLNGRGIIYTHNGYLEKAIADFDRAILLDPDNPAPYANRAHAYRKKGELDRAIADYETALKLAAPNVANLFEGFLNDAKQERGW